jgi:hypothetical protein
VKRSGHRVTRQTHVIELTDVDIGKLLLRAHLIAVPQTAAVYVRVPGGGDWSNTKLAIGSDANVIVEWDELS